MPSRPHLLFTVNTDWFFLSHRLPLALAAKRSGMRVTVLAPDTGRSGEIRDHGLAFESLSLSRAGLGPLTEAKTVAYLARAYALHQPDVVHHVTPKPVIYGSLAARALRHRAVLNAVTGLGHVFSSRQAVLPAVVRSLYRAALAPPSWRATFQNDDDRELFVRLGMISPAQAVLIRGAGVDIERFTRAPEPSGDPVVLLASRMLQEKGVEEFVGAAQLLRREGLAARFVLVGAPDPGAPSSIPRAQLDGWSKSGIVEWWGHRNDMANVLRSCHVAVLPTFYREGLPKILLEAAASGRALVATNVPGCREIVIPGETGLLVPPRNALALARAIERLVCNPGLRSSMGARARHLAESSFSEEQVVSETLAVYADLLGRGW